MHSSFLRVQQTSSNMKNSGLLFVVLLFMFGQNCLAVSHPKPSCRYPPSQWCSSLEIAIQCKVQKQCMELRAIRPHRPAPPISLTLVYQSLCPGWRLFISQQLFPTWTLLRDVMTVKLVPFNRNKALSSTDSSPTCQPEDAECKANMIQACVVDLTGHSALEIISCMEAAADVLSAAPTCVHLYAPGVSWSSVDSCVTGPMGVQLLQRNTALTRALSPAPTHLPWLTLNGEYSPENEDKAMSSLFKLICQLYKGIKPPVCTGVPVRMDRGFC